MDRLFIGSDSLGRGVGSDYFSVHLISSLVWSQ